MRNAKRRGLTCSRALRRGGGGCSALKLKVGMRAPMCVKSLGKCARSLKKKSFSFVFLGTR